MENITRALIMAFSMLMFVIAFSYSMYLINKLTTTSNTLLTSITTKNYYDSIKVSGENTTTREVDVDTIISTLYRYDKENYAVKIVDGDEIIQVFDMSLETKMTDPNFKKSIYNDKSNKAYLFEAPWTGKKEDIIARINYFLNGTKGYINNTLVDYESTIGAGGFLGKYGSETFIESFVEYAYEGETISTENGVETITGNTQESSKIIITYKVK